jgi:hypothetical protein
MPEPEILPGVFFELTENRPENLLNLPGAVGKYNLKLIGGVTKSARVFFSSLYCQSYCSNQTCQAKNRVKYPRAVRRPQYSQLIQYSYLIGINGTTWNQD